MNGDVTIQRDFLPDDLIDEIRESCANSKLGGLNLTDWASKVVHTSGPILLYEIQSHLLYRLLLIVKSKVALHDNAHMGYVRYTLGGRFSYIPWHDDGNHKMAVTIYLNKIWNMDWNGYFIYQDGSEYKAVVPEYNKAVIVKSPVMHCTVMPSIDAPLRESIQIFVD